MIRLSACIEMLFNDLPFNERPAAAKAAGFDAIEFWDWSGKDIPALAEACSGAGIPAAVCCTGTRDDARKAAYADGALLKPRNAGVFTEIIEETVEAVRPLGIRTLITTVGQALPDVSRYVQHDSIVTCLRAAAPTLAKHGVTLVVEPLNILVNHKGYYLDRSDEAFAILDAVDSPQVKLLFDVYHQQITEGNVISNFTARIDRIGHFHIADVPGRCQPGTGELNYANILRAIAGTEYDQYVGCEYRAAAGTDSFQAARAAVDLANLYK